jgi:hypothetical protein
MDKIQTNKQKKHNPEKKNIKKAKEISKKIKLIHES